MILDNDVLNIVYEFIFIYINTNTSIEHFLISICNCIVILSQIILKSLSYGNSIFDPLIHFFDNFLFALVLRRIFQISSYT